MAVQREVIDVRHLADSNSIRVWPEKVVRQSNGAWFLHLTLWGSFDLEDGRVITSNTDHLHLVCQLKQVGRKGKVKPE